MREGFFLRAALAILLMVSMLAPLGTCLRMTHKSGHSCCAPASVADKTAQTNCCTASIPLPAVVVAPPLSVPALMAVKPEIIAIGETSTAAVFSSAAFIPPQSPPPGVSILRI